MAEYLMAVDAGTGSIRAAVFTPDGIQVGCIQKEWDHPADPRFPGSMDFLWERHWACVCGCIRQVLAESRISPKDILAVSTTSMREGIVLYDAQGKELWACANVDARSDHQVAQLRQADPELEKAIYRRSGQTYALSALPRLLWVRDNLPEIYQKTARMGMLNDWLAYKLTGRLAVEPSNGATTGMMDICRRVWLPEIAQECGLRTDIFPAVVECGTPLGQVNYQGSADTSLLPGTPVVVGGGDCQTGCIGVGAVEPGQAAVFGGSFWQYEFNTSSPVADPQCRVRLNCHAAPGLWQYEALAFKPGLVTRWFRDGFCQEEAAKARDLGVEPYTILDQGAQAVPAGSYGMQCCFSDTMDFLRWQHASPTFTNFQLEPERFGKFTFYRAILENTALVVRSHIELVNQTTARLPTELIFAGGASKSPLWSQILADVTGLPVKLPVVREASALGTALLAGIGVGVYASAADVAKAVRWERRYEPNPAHREVYDALYRTWQEVYTAQAALSRAGVTTPLWSAPGLEETRPEPLVHEADRRYRFGDSGPKYLLRGPRASFAVVRFLPGQDFQAHYHTVMEEDLYVVEGKAKIWVDGTQFSMSAGDLVHIEPGQIHYVWNPYGQVVRMTSTLSPYRAGDKELVENPPIFLKSGQVPPGKTP